MLSLVADCSVIFVILVVFVERVAVPPFMTININSMRGCYFRRSIASFMNVREADCLLAMLRFCDARFS